MPELTITARENGSTKVTGRFRYIDENGVEQVTGGDAIFLCRCGGSAKKPFCDGTHRKIGFQAPGCELTLVEE